MSFLFWHFFPQGVVLSAHSLSEQVKLLRELIMDTFLTKGQYATYPKNFSLTVSCYHFCKGKVMMFFLRKLDIFTVGGICKIVYLFIFCFFFDRQ